MNEFEQKQELSKYARRMWDRGWVANHDGNISLRLKNGRILCTPTGVSKGEIAADMILTLDENGKVVAGKLRPFSEINLHLAYFRARPDVHAVMHAHPPTATGFGVAGASLDSPLLPEAVVSLGPQIPTVPLALPGAAAAAALAPYLDDFDALLLAGNGALTVGAELEQAYLRLELVEHLARIALVAIQLGGARKLPASFLELLLTARQKAGLGPQARQPSSRAAVLTLADYQPREGELARTIKQAVDRQLG